jgi:hypothetical protein
MPVSGDAHLREYDEIDMLTGSFLDELLNDRKIIGLVVLVMVELY